MPSSAPSDLDLAEQQFRNLIAATRPPTIDGISVEDVRVTMLKRRTTPATVQAVCAHLIRMARARPNPWVTVATGMMIPSLKSVAGKFGRRYRGDRRDLDSEILTGFLQALADVDPDEPGLFTRLYRAAFRRGRTECEHETRMAARHTELTGVVQGFHCESPGNPDLVLAEAVRGGVITPRQADLVCGIHLDHGRRREVARSLGVTPYQIKVELTAARRGLSQYLNAV